MLRVLCPQQEALAHSCAILRLLEWVLQRDAQEQPHEALLSRAKRKVRVHLSGLYERRKGREVIRSNVFILAH